MRHSHSIEQLVASMAWDPSRVLGRPAGCVPPCLRVPAPDYVTNEDVYAVIVVLTPPEDQTRERTREAILDHGVAPASRGLARQVG